MRRDWNSVGMLLHTIEKLSGHPNLKELRDDALADLADLAAEPMVRKGPPVVGPSDMAGATPIGATGPTEVHPLDSGLTGTTDATGATGPENDLHPAFNPDGSVVDHHEPKISRRSL